MFLQSPVSFCPYFLLIQKVGLAKPLGLDEMI